MSNLVKTIIGFIFVFLMIACQKQITNPKEKPIYTVTFEDHTSGYSFPSDGVYYEYPFSSYTEKIENGEEFLINLYNQGIIIIDAWYQAGSNMCVPPGSDIGMTVIVEPRFIILLESKDNSVAYYNFQQVESPSSIFCGYYVTRYTLKR
jgi:hypothetical protein